MLVALEAVGAVVVVLVLGGLAYWRGYEDGARSVELLLDRARWEQYGRQVHGG